MYGDQPGAHVQGIGLGTWVCVGGLGPGPRGANQALRPPGQAQGLNVRGPVLSEGLGPGFMRAFLKLGLQGLGWIGSSRPSLAVGQPGSLGPWKWASRLALGGLEIWGHSGPAQCWMGPKSGSLVVRYLVFVMAEGLGSQVFTWNLGVQESTGSRGPYELLGSWSWQVPG